MITGSTPYKINSASNFTSLVNSQLRNLESDKAQRHKQTKHNDVNKALKPAVVASSALGILAVLRLISKGKSNFDLLKPQSWKNLASKETEYGAKEIIAIAGGSVLGGMTGGILVDKKNTKHKTREAISQMVGNVLIPVTCVSAINFLVRDVLKIPERMPQLKSVDKVAKYTNGALKTLPGVVFSLLGLGFGIINGNKIANKLNSIIFDKGEKTEARQVKVSDLAIHIDDICYTSTLIAPDNKVCQQVGKLTPLALMVAGVSTGLANGEAHHH